MTELHNWLEKIGLGKYAPHFVENEIGFELLAELTNDDLKELGIPLGPRKVLLKAIAELAQNSAPDGSPGLTDLGSTDAERRQLTVMFCDLAGSTALSGQMDPEEFRDIILAYQEACTKVIERFGGVIARYFGDGMLVYFGYPQAHEDDAERAVRAGLGVVESIEKLSGDLGKKKNIELAVRVGIATGPVVVGDIVGEGASQESTVLGETPNLAARLQGLAVPNSVVIAPATQEMLGGLFTYEDLGQRELKGIAKPVNAWKVAQEEAIESRFEATHAQQLTPLVGRDEELDTLQRRWERVQNGEGQVVLISGEPGIGKSRLTQALRQRLQEETHTVLRYQCSPYNTNSALHPIIEQLQRAAGFGRDDTSEQKLDKLETLLAESSEDVQTVAPLFAALLSIPSEDRYPLLKLTPQQQKDQTLTVLNDQLFGLAVKQPVLLVFEDAHWIDPTTHEWLDLVLAQIQDKRVLTVLTYRPEFQPSWAGEAHVTAMSLNKLPQKNCTSLIENITGGKPLPEEVARQIVAKTDGVPLFVEELTKTVLESGLLKEETDRYALDGSLPPLAIPNTLQDSLMARLDRLASVKDIAQIGAVVGREFSYELIHAVANVPDAELDQALGKLIDAGLIFRRGTPPDANYTFKHALIQDTAYASLLKSRRQQLHAKIATVLESRFAAQVESQPELAAHHLGQAGLPERAIEYWRKAAALAGSRSAMQEAYSHLGAALTAQKELPQTDDNQRLRLDLLAELITPISAIKSYSSPEMVELYEDAMSVYQTIGGDTPQIFPIIYARWVFEFTSRPIKAALERGREFLATAEHQAARVPTIMGRRLCGNVMVINGDAVQGCRYLEQVLEELDEGLSDEIGFVYAQDTLAAANCYYAFGLCALGKFEQAHHRIEFALKRAAGLDNAMTIAYVNGHLGFLLAEIGDDAGLARCITTMETTLSEHPMPVWAASLGYLQGMKALTEDRNGLAVAFIEKSLTAMDSLGFVLWRPIFQGNLARAQLAEGRHDPALESVSRGLAEIERGRDAWMEPELHRIRATILASRGRPRAEIEACYQEALDKTRAQPNRLYELRAALSLARLWRDQGKRDEARALLEPIYSWFTEGFDTPDLKDAKTLLAELE